jgi:opacity protein-like surface antigen
LEIAMLRTALVRFSKTPIAAIRIGVLYLLAIPMAMAMVTAFALVLATQSASAQDWGAEPSDSRSAPPAPEYSGGSAARTGWSARAGIGFTADPDTLLLNFELPYSFDRWVSAGPMLQVGIDNNEMIVAPTANVTVTIPDLPGERFDRLHPYSLIGIGFAVLEDDSRRNNKTAAGFLVNFGFGLEYQLSERFYVGSQMIFNFLPEETLGEKFFYAWQVGGMRVTF